MCTFYSFPLLHVLSVDEDDGENGVNGVDDDCKVVKDVVSVEADIKLHVDVVLVDVDGDFETELNWCCLGYYCYC